MDFNTWKGRIRSDLHYEEEVKVGQRKKMEGWKIIIWIQPVSKKLRNVGAPSLKAKTKVERRKERKGGGEGGTEKGQHLLRGP